MFVCVCVCVCACVRACARARARLASPHEFEPDELICNYPIPVLSALLQVSLHNRSPGPLAVDTPGDQGGPTRVVHLDL